MSEKEEVAEEEVLSISQIQFKDKNLEEWATFLTVYMPQMPATVQALSRTLATLNDKFQISYNCYNELMIMHREVSVDLKRKLSVKTRDAIVEMRAEGVGRIPAKDTLDSIEMSKSEQLQELDERKQMYEIIMDFFENNKTKLGLSMKSASDLLYAANHSDRMFVKSERTGGM